MHMSSLPTQGAAQHSGCYTGRLTAESHWRSCDKCKKLSGSPLSLHVRHTDINTPTVKGPAPSVQEYLSCDLLQWCQKVNRDGGPTPKHTSKVEHIYTLKIKKSYRDKIASSLYWLAQDLPFGWAVGSRVVSATTVKVKSRLQARQAAARTWRKCNFQRRPYRKNRWAEELFQRDHLVKQGAVLHPSISSSSCTVGTNGQYH